MPILWLVTSPSSEYYNRTFEQVRVYDNGSGVSLMVDGRPCYFGYHEIHLVSDAE